MLALLVEQLSNPIVAGAVAFVVGVVFTTIVDLVAREISAHLDDARRRRTAALTHRLESVRRTQQYVWSLSEFAARRHQGAAAVIYEPTEFADARIRYVGDATLLNEYHALLLKLFQAPPRTLGSEVIGEFGVLRDRMIACLEDAEELLIAGKEPPVTSRTEFDEEVVNRAASLGIEISRS